jgi:hypothetical protein
MSSQRFISQIKKNSDTRKGRYRSPLLPICGRRIWSRTARTPSSPTFWTPRGTIFGLRNAIQNTPRTIAAETTMIRIGLVNWNEPIVKSGLK